VIATAVTREQQDAERKARLDRAIEVLAVVLLGVATVGSAWCGYQASRWNGEESDAARASATARIDASRLFSLGVQQISYDASVTAQYAAAVAGGNENLQTFIKNNLVRPAYLPVLEEWEKRVRAGETGGGIFQNQAYLDAQAAPSREAEAKDAAFAVKAQEASANSDDYVLTALIMASALFFAGVTTSFRSPGIRVALLATATLVIAVAAARIADLPVST
jgi:hypothetical protein